MASAVYPDQKTRFHPDTISQLKKDCKENHFETGRPATRMILAAAAVAAIFVFFALEGRFIQLPLSFGFFFTIGDLLSRAYHSLRNRTSIKAAEALDDVDFQTYLANQNCDIQAQNISQYYADYQKARKV